MSEASTQKLLVAMACAFGLALVLVGYGRQRDQGFERLSLKSTPSTAARPTKPITSPAQPIATGRVIPQTNQNSARWQSVPTTARTPLNVSSVPTREIPAPHSTYDNSDSIRNYFSPSTTLESRASSQANTRHPSAQKLAQRNQQLQQRAYRDSLQPTDRQALQTRPTIQFHDFGNVGQAVATRTIPNQNSSVRRADVQAQIPDTDLFQVRKKPARDENSLPSVSVLKTQSLNPLGQTKANEQAIVTRPLPRQVTRTDQSDVAAKIPSSATAPSRMDRQVRKANWAEIEPAHKVDPMTSFRPLQQPTLQKRNANPQIESAAREQIQYGQSLARRRAYFAAREEFIRALLSIATSYNTESNSTAHPERLAQGLVAIDEMEDFARLNGNLLQQKVLSHKSNLLTPQDIATTSPMEAVGRYSNFAQSQIVQAIGASKAGSEALHALGKLESMVPEADRNQIKTLVFLSSRNRN